MSHYLYFSLVGDTPTIYAGAANVTDIEKVDNVEEDKGLSIFGIPIPTIPISLSFGLAPAISQVFSNGGLIPLGRKGEASQEKHSIEEPIDEILTEDDQTKGPDTQVPVWVDKFKNIDFKKLASLFPSTFPSTKKSESGEEEEENNKVKRKTTFNNYLKPNNPIIPLSGSDSSGYFPHHSQSPSGGYFPVDSGETVPILKFDHPLHPMLPPNTPVFPPETKGEKEASIYQQILNKKLSTVSKTDLQELVGGGGGFQPMFIPAKHDGNFVPPLTEELFKAINQPELERQKVSAFPGIEATMRNDLVSTTEMSPLDTYGPSIVIEEVPPYDNDYNYYYEEKSPYSFLPEYVNDFKSPLPADSFIPRSTESSASERSPQRTPDILDFTVSSTEADGGRDVTTEYDPRRRNKNNKKEAADFLQNLLAENNALEILSMTTPPPPPSTEMDIQLDILHKGTPKHEQTTMESAEEVEESQTAEPQYEYEYVYYYEDEEVPDEDPDTVTELTSTEREPDSTSRSSLKSLLSFLNRESTTFTTSSQPGPGPTPYPAIRDSTIQYDRGEVESYPELQRSTVTVEIEDNWSR